MRYIAKVLSIKKGDEEQCLVILTGSPAIPRSQSKLTGKAGRPPGCRAREKARTAHLVPDVGSGLADRAVGVGVAHAVPLVLDLALAGVHGPFGPGFGGFGPGRHWGIPDELLALRSEAAEVARLFAIASRGAFENKERVAQLRSFLDRSHKELSDMIYSSAQGQATGTSEGESASGSSDVGQA